MDARAAGVLRGLRPTARRGFGCFPLPPRRFMSPSPGVHDDGKSYASLGFRAMPEGMALGARMSALGQKQTSAHVHVMSALPPKADIGTQERDVRFVPKADIPVA